MADALVKSNVRGVDTHGVFHLSGYVKAVQDGKLDATASPSIVRETPNTALVDGNRTFGHVAAKFATDVAVRKAKENDVAVVGMVRSEHIGRLGEYAEMAADPKVWYPSSVAQDTLCWEAKWRLLTVAARDCSARIR